MKREVVTTDDGSSSIYIPEMDEHYHSSHGAIQEARHVFIENGIRNILSNRLNVFEFGFGTGLNALLTLEFAKVNNIYVDYNAIEAFPVEDELIKSLNYIELVGVDYKESFEKLHNSAWDRAIEITNDFKLHKIHSKIQVYELQKAKYDIIYFDAFGPRVQSEMWGLEVLRKMYDGLKVGGVFVTYCAQGQFKRDLKELGFKVEALPGPPGKREMTRAVKV